MQPLAYPTRSTKTTQKRTFSKRPAPQDPCLPPPSHPQNRPFWFTSERKGIACAKKLKRPVIIDFWADWCTSCKKLERESFNHPEAVKESRRFVMIKVEYSEQSKEDERLRKKYDIPGLPWVRFLDSKGKLLQKPLIVGFVPHQKLLKLMHRVK